LRLLLDQGLPRGTVERLSERGIEAVHTADVGLASAPDASILAFAREEDRVVVTLDADFRAEWRARAATRRNALRESQPRGGSVPSLSTAR
jgi:predicted nuclease of predicted toxin-antitoxin system